jgi:hypothetical protein
MHICDAALCAVLKPDDPANKKAPAIWQGLWLAENALKLD